jgi:lipopolysaccharide/colanic/teichoic acid biosynthesis glycosyltransferase
MRALRHGTGVVLVRPVLILLLGCAFLTAVYIRFYSGLIPVADLPHWPAYLAYFVLSAAVWTALEARAPVASRLSSGTPLIHWAGSLVKLDAITLATVSACAFFFRDYSFSRFTVLLFWSLHLVLSMAAAWLLRARLRRHQAEESICIEIGSEETPTVEQALAFLRTLRIPRGCREVLIVLPIEQARHVPDLSDALHNLPVPGSIIVPAPPLTEAHSTREWVAFSTGPSADIHLDYAFVKRAFDVIVSAAGLVLLAPLLAGIALVTWVRSGRPVFIRQERVGQGERRFRLLKFRTLPVETLRDSDHQWNVQPADGRGEFLRATGFDELPQLLNVLRGDMSLVGPRPERPHFVEQFRHQLPLYSARHRFQVGITGWAQVHGLRGDTSIPARVEHDLYYLNHWSLALDLRILRMTVANFWRTFWPRVSGYGSKADAGLL